MKHPGRGLLAALLGLAASSLSAAPGGSPSPRSPVATSLIVFAGTREGLWRSRDWGGSWERVKESGLDGLGAARCAAPLGPLVYLGGDGGLYVSTDFGDVWTHTYAATPVQLVLSSRYPESDPTLFLGTADGLLKSEDGGRTVRPTALKGALALRLEWPGPALVVGTSKGVQISEDAGEHFKDASEGLPVPLEVRSLALSSFYLIDPVLFAGTTARGVFHSSDGARRWNASGLEGRTVEDLYWLGPFLYAVTEGGLFRSEDVGRTWVPLGEGLGKAHPTRLLFPLAPDNGAEIFLATDVGVYWTGDGGFHWQASGLEKQEVLWLATFPAALRNFGKKPKR